MTVRSEPLTPTPWPPAATIDVKHFMRALSQHRADRPIATTGQWRRVVSLIEARPVQISAVPIPVVGFLDGIQARCLAARVEHRDITLVYVAAGCVHEKTLLNIEERLAAVCGTQDEALVHSVDPSMPVVTIPDLHPWTLALETNTWIDETRQALEARALQNAPMKNGHVVVVDGSLSPSSARQDAIGVVKRALDTDWLTDPSLIPVKAGWRSPALLIPAPRHGERDRLTAFVRLRTASGDQQWGFSLVRVETFAEAGLPVLDAAAALVMSERQPLTSGDPRAEVQMASMYRTEQVLKARRPFVIEHCA